MNEEIYYQVDLEPFPLEALPANLRQLTEAAAANIQIAPDLFAVPLLAALCIPLQSRFMVRVDSGYTEPLCLYTLTIARPSERKSAVMSLLERPFWEWQQAANADKKPWEKYKTLYVTDATPERLARLMEENAGSISLMSDEPDALSVAAGLRYGKGKNLGLMLQAWSAGRVMVQRATDEVRISIDRATMSVAIMSQPSFVEKLVKDTEMSSRGFLQRFLFSRPLSRVGSRSFLKPDIPKILLDEYALTVTEFLKMENDNLWTLEFSSGAKKMLSLYFDVIEQQIKQNRNPAIEGWMGKIFGQVIRLAGVLHCAQWGKESAEHLIDDTVTAAAEKLGNYFISHAKAVFTDVNTSEELDDARELYRRMKESGMTVFTKSDLYMVTKRNLPKARLESALSQLLNAQYIGIIDETADDRTRRYTLFDDIRGLDESLIW
ncbi:MAG: DUF3987 domain-containing protein [Oscillibacter sp.]|nr:DUF3987 domain-containing protein [Paludibacteraceae bacterium]MBR0283487.1 DUF3987 domain-containing protein [Oscillibacter sp.]